MIETERKFLVADHSYRELAYSCRGIVQGYLCYGGGGNSVRVRIYGEQAFLTIKGPSGPDGMSRFEWEKEISVEEARDLMRLCVSGIVDKTRYLVKSGSHVVEVDEFHGANAGLVMAEIELASPQEQFLRPGFLGKEVTGDVRYYNSYLSEHPFSTWGE